MPEQQKRISTALDSMHQVRCVNQLIQGLCARMDSSELTLNEAKGLWVMLEWQNEKLSCVEGVFKTVSVGKAANNHAA